MKNNSGYTLIEVLAVIVIISLIAGVGALAYTSIIRSSEDKAYETYERTMHTEIMSYIINHVAQAPKNNKSKKFWIKVGNKTSSLANTSKDGFFDIDQINNPRDKNDICLNSYVTVTRKDTSVGHNSYTYRVCLKCNNYNTDESKCKTYEN